MLYIIPIGESKSYATYAKDVFIQLLFLEVEKTQRMDIVWDVYMPKWESDTFNEVKQRDRNTLHSFIPLFLYSKMVQETSPYIIDQSA